jgi:hypothetical protein
MAIHFDFHISMDIMPEFSIVTKANCILEKSIAERSPRLRQHITETVQCGPSLALVQSIKGKITQIERR